MRRLTALMLALLLGATATRALAAGSSDVHPLKDIKDTIGDFIRRQPALADSEFEVRVGNLDPRLRLARCSDALEPFLPAGRRLAGNVSVGVRCGGTHPWTVYVPARIAVYRDVVMLNRPIARGERIAREDVSLERRETSRIGQGYIARVEEIVGLQARRSLSAGTTPRASMLAQPTLIRRGEQVVLLARVGALEVRTAGQALVDGSRGQVIRVRNARSSKVVEGVVVAQGVVQVRM